MIELGFRGRVEAVVRRIPRGRVMTYGQLAVLCGNARAARIVDGIAHFGDPALPWQRVVNKSGGLAAGYPGGRAAHAEHLRAEGIMVSGDMRVDVEKLLWRPEDSSISHQASSIESTIYDTRHPQPDTLVAIVGETASGKSALALELAERFDGEIICADAMTVYRGFDIGTAKPSETERANIPHHLLDVADPAAGFNVATFQALAKQAVGDIISRGRLPIMVGGSGLYIDSLLYDYELKPSPNIDERDVLNTMELSELLTLAVSRGLDISGVDVRNKRRVIRLIENGGVVSARANLRPHTCIIGMQIERNELESRVKQRVEGMLLAGLESEVRGLSEKYSWDSEPMKSIGYREWRENFAGRQSLDETEARIVRSTMQLAKKQRTWFKRNNSTQWVSDPSIAVDIVTTFLNK